MIAKSLSLMSLLNDLRSAKIHYQLSQRRDEAIMVEVAVPGERWEIEFMEDGSVEVEVFRSDGQVRGADAIQHLLARHTD